MKKYFSQSVNSLFILLTAFFAENTFFILMNSNLSVFLSQVVFFMSFIRTLPRLRLKDFILKVLWFYIVY